MGTDVIILAGSVCGVLDLISAAALFRSKGVSFERLLQFIASGALGESAFRNGKKSAVLGLLFHFSIGVIVHLFMTFAVLPLSRTLKRTFSVSAFVHQLLVHMVVVGPSISLVVAISVDCASSFKSCLATIFAF
jgi:hypothetical protein